MRINNIQALLGDPMLSELPVFPVWGDQEMTALREAMTGRWGHESDQFAKTEEAFALMQDLPASHAAVVVGSGSSGLRLAYQTLDIGVGDEVIVPGSTWQATAGEVLAVNATPVLLDIQSRSWTLDPDAVEAYFERCRAEGRALPKAVVVVHLFHMIGDLDRLAEICRRWGVFLIEDCAHAHGGMWNGRPLGTYGAISVFSHEGSKTDPAHEMGTIVTGVRMLEERARSLRTCGRKIASHELTVDETVAADELTNHWRSQVAELGLNAWPIQASNDRTSPLTAAVAAVQCERFTDQNAARATTVRELDRTLDTVPGITRLPLDPRVTQPMAYRYAFLYDAEQFAGMDQALFMEVLSYLLSGAVVVPTYDPLGGGETGYTSPVYNPQTLRRFNLSAEYWAEIDPARWPLPVSHDAFERGITITHPVLMSEEAAPAIVRALRLMYDNAAAIVAAATPQHG